MGRLKRRASMTALLMATLALGGMAIAEQKPMIQPTL